MDTKAADHSRPDIHDRHAAIAQQWFHALASAGCFQLDRAEALEKFSHLTDQVIGFLESENPPGNVAREIGGNLASLPCLDPHAMEISTDLWVKLMVEGVFPAETPDLHPRMLALIKGMAAGFAGRAHAILLNEQEDIRAAMAADLLRTTEELRKYQGQLEAMLAERTRELQESEAQFRAIAETSIDGVFQSVGDEGELIYVNAAFAQMLGYTTEELLGKTNLSLIPDEDLPRLASIGEDMTAGRPVQGEFRLKHKDGHLVDIHFSNVPTVLNGRIVRSGILQDITERKQAQAALFLSEERYRTLTEASPDLIFIIDRDDRIRYVNSFAADFLALPPQEIIGQSHMRFFPAPTRDRQKKHIMKVLKVGKTFYYEGEIKMHDLSFWLGTWLVPLRDAAGAISSIMGVSRDITKQKQAEMEILSSRDDLEKRVEERTAELTASQNKLRQLSNQLVSALEDERRRISRELHDEAGQGLISLKYALTSLETEIPEKNLFARSRLVNSIDDLDQVMVQIRTLSHSLRPPVLELVGINLSLRDYCEEFAKRTTLTVHYQGEEVPDLPDEIGLSLYRFAQEGLTNILKHSHATKAEVRLQYKEKQVALTISDNGCGMEKPNHTDGIGLIGIEERLNLLGGTLQIHSRKGQGVALTARVPWPGPAEKD